MKLVNGAEWSSPKRNKSRRELMQDPIRSMSLDENLDVLLKVCDGMAYAHSMGVVNRDLKPENVVVGDFGEVIILDWGLAVPAQDSVSNKFSSPTASFGAGTAYYMAPELWTGPAEAIGRHSDTYLLGAMLFELISGVPPHEFPTPTKAKISQSERFRLMNEVIAENLIRTTDINGDELEETELLKIALKAMDTNPKLRYHSVQELQTAIREYQKHEESRHLARRADSLMEDKTGAKTEGYEDYQTATALYEEALRGWPKNEPASEGLFYSKLKYAELANTRGDFDLGLQLVEGRKAKEYVAVAKKLEAGKSRRGRAKGTIAALLGVILIAGPASAIYMYNQSSKLGVAQIGLDAAIEKQAEAERLALEADDKAKEAENKTIAAVAKKEEALAAQEEAVTAKMEADMAAEQAKMDAEEAANAKLVADMAAAQADMAAEQAKMDAEEAANAKMMADMAAERAKMDAEKAENAAKAAAFQSQVATKDSFVRTSNFSGAIAKINELLSGDAFKALEPSEQKQKQSELEKQREQLKELASQTVAPVSLQRIAPNRNIVAWLHARTKTQPSKITLRKLDPITGEIGEKIEHEFLSADSVIADIQFDGTGENILCAEGDSVVSWNYSEKTRTTILNANSPIVVMALAETTIVTAGSDRSLKGWAASTGEELWSYQPDTSPLDLAYLQDEKILVLVGSRDDTSADVVAFDLTSTGLQRRKDGQLKYTPTTIAPPKVIAVSPRDADIQIAVISNSRDGSFLVLPKNTNGGFPFKSPSEMLPKETDAGSEQAARQPNSQQVHGITFFDGGRFFANANPYWNELSVTGHNRPVNAIAFSDDGRFFATASDDLSVKVWQVTGSGTSVSIAQAKFPSDLEPSKAESINLLGHGAPVTDVAFFDQNTLLTTSRDRWCRVWKIDEYEDKLKIIRESIEGAGQETMSEVKPTENLLKEKRDFTLETGTTKRIKTSGAKTLAYSLPKYIPTVAPLAAELNVVELNSSDAPVLRGGIKSLDVTANGSRIVTGATDGTAVIWDAATGKVIRGLKQQVEFHHERGRLFEEGHKFNISKLAFLPQRNQYCLSTSFDGSLCLWEFDEDGGGKEKCRLTDLRLINAFGVSGDGQFLITSAAENKTTRDESNPRFPCVQWNIDQLLTGDTPEPVAAFEGFHTDVITAIAVSSNSEVVATGAKDGYVAFWEPGTAKQLGEIRAHTNKTLVTDLVWLDDSSLLSTGIDGQIRLWAITRDPSSGRVSAEVRTNFEGSEKSPVDSVSLAPGHNEFLTIHANFVGNSDDVEYDVYVWNINQTQKLGKLRLAATGKLENGQPTTGLISSASWSSDGNRVAVVAGGQINIIDTSTWAVEKVLVSGVGADAKRSISNAVFASVGGRQILATFDGNTTQLWDRSTYKLLTTFRPQQSVAQTALSNDDEHRYLATGSRSLRIFNAKEDSDGYGQTLAKKDAPHLGLITAIEFGQNPTMLLTGGADNQLKLWNWDGAKASLIESSSRDLDVGAIVDVKLSMDDNQILVVGSKNVKLLAAPNVGGSSLDNWIEVPLQMNIEDDVQLKCGDFADNGTAITFGGQFESTGGSIGYVLTKSPEADDFSPFAEFSGHGAGGISAIEFINVESPTGGRYLVTSGIDGAAIIWNWSTSVPHQAYRFLTPGIPGAAHRAAITDLVVSDSGQNIATSSDDGTALVWQNPFQ